MKAWILVVLLACRHGVEPGETRCTTRNVFGVAQTRCETGSAVSWWCTKNNDWGTCYRTPGRCELEREKTNRPMPASMRFGPCFEQASAICGEESGCYTDARSCVAAERNNGEDGSECRATLNGGDD